MAVLDPLLVDVLTLRKRALDEWVVGCIRDDLTTAAIALILSTAIVSLTTAELQEQQREREGAIQ